MPNQAYTVLLNMDEAGKVSWVSEIKLMLQKLGFSYVTVSCSVSKKKKKRFIYIYNQV